MRALVALVMAVAAVAAASPTPSPTPGAANGWICVPPLKGDYGRCFKGQGGSEESVLECFERHAKERRGQQRFRVGRGRWIEFSRTRRRCVPVPLGERVRVYFEEVADDWATATLECPRLDVWVNTFYGSIRRMCARRDTSRDEVIEQP